MFISPDSFINCFMIIAIIITEVRNVDDHFQLSCIVYGFVSYIFEKDLMYPLNPVIEPVST